MNFTINLTQVIVAIITVLGGIVVRYLIPLLKKKTSEKTYSIILMVCETAVYFAQQWYKTEDGDVKKEKAIEYVRKELEARGIIVDMSLVEDCIEAEVKKMKLAIKASEQGET